MNEIQQIGILQGNNDGRNVESIVTFAVVNQTIWEMTGADFNVYQWIDGDSDATMKEFLLSFHTSTGQCINSLYVIAFTTGARNSGADQVYRIELRAKGVTKVKELPNLPGDDYLELKNTYGS